MRQSSEAIRNLLTDFLQTLRIPAARIDGQLATRNLPPSGNTGSGYTPAEHATTHESGGDDAIDLGSLAGTLTDTQHGTRGGGTLHAEATSSVAGFLSAAKSALLDRLSIAVGKVLTASNTITFAATSDGFTITFSATGTPALKTGTPTAGNVAAWDDADTVEDAGYAATDVARLSQANTFTADQAVSGTLTGQGVVAEGGGLRVNHSSGSYTTYSSSQASPAINHYCVGGTNVNLDINPIPGSASGVSAFRFFRSVNTTGAVYFTVHKGDGTATTNCQIAGNTHTYLNANAGAVRIGKSSGSTTQGNLDVAGDVLTDGVYRKGSTQVLGAQRTGWSAATGTATRTSFATSTVTTSQLAERVKALLDDLIAHGIIGA